jgi:cholesterol transport system auxiliary component
VTRSRLITAATLAAAGLALSGCITLFPKATPVQLYRFGAEPAKLGVAAGAPFNLQRSSIQFARAAQSDAILTTTGAQTAYIAGARWVGPAVVLFDEALDRAFDAAAGPARLVPRGEMGSNGANLKLDVETFEARYADAGAPPTVVVRVHALLIRTADRTILAERVFDVQKPAEADRVSAIVHAFDDAATDAIGQIVTWTEAEGEPTAARS